MANPGAAMRAYASAVEARAPREQEAELFREVNAALRRASTADNRARVRALADNVRLWNAVDRLLRDPDNALPTPLRAAIVSIGLAVQREMRRPAPDFDFLISVNEDLAAGLSNGR